MKHGHTRHMRFADAREAFNRATHSDALATKVRQPLTDWEDAEKERVREMESIMSRIANDAKITIDDTAETVRARGSDLFNLELDPEIFKAGLDEAKVIKAQAIDVLKEGLARLVKEEADRAELERLRKAEAEREAGGEHE